MKVTGLRAHGQVSLCSHQSHSLGSKWVARSTEGLILVGLGSWLVPPLANRGHRVGLQPPGSSSSPPIRRRVDHHLVGFPTPLQRVEVGPVEDLDTPRRSRNPARSRLTYFEISVRLSLQPAHLAPHPSIGHVHLWISRGRAGRAHLATVARSLGIVPPPSFHCRERQ
eukprot:192092-Rhodomonas_salina.1